MDPDNDIEARIERIFRAVFPEESIPVRRMTPMNSSAWDSLAHMNLLLSIEEEFGISLTDDESLDLKSFDIAAEVVAGKLK